MTWLKQVAATIVVMACCATTGRSNDAGPSVAAIQEWVIVVAADAIPSEVYAAQEFQSFFEQATSKRLPIRQHANGHDGHVLIGPGAVAAGGPLASVIHEFGPEDFRVVVHATGIEIAGGRPRGTLYGVTTFLQNALGIRFLTPEHTHVPKFTNTDRLPVMDRTYRPPLRFRWSFFGEIAEDHAFATRMRTNTVQSDPKFGGKTPITLIGHSFGHLMPWAKYGEAHPEYYNEVDGTRPSDIWNDQYSPGVQLCTTSPDVLRIATDAVQRDLRANPGRGNIAVAQNDNDRYCQCHRCRELNQREESPMGSLLGLVNHVAGAVAREHPDVMVGTLAYSYSRKPPRTIRPEPNVQIQLCSFECCQVHALDDPKCAKNRQFCNDLKAWCGICENVYVWTYMTNFHNYLIPCPNLRSLGRNVHLFAESGVKGLFMQGPAAGAELGGLRNYVISNLIWNPTRDADELMAEFLTLHYGRAAPMIGRYIDLVHDTAEQSGKHRNCFGNAIDHGIDVGVAERGLKIFEEALKHAESDEVRKRVEKASIACHALLVEPVVSPAFQKVRSRKKRRDPTPFQLDPEVARRLRPQLAIFLRLCRQHHIPRIGEWASVEEVIQVLKEGYGMNQSDSF